MRVLAISDIHLDFAGNLRAMSQIPPYPEDWLILAGDIGHRLESLKVALEILVPRFKRLIWVPGNHDLWKTKGENGEELKGERKYQRQVSICREHGVLTPEDPYPTIESQDGRTYVLAPLFTLYDYSFRPSHVSEEEAVHWAMETGVLCTDEQYLDPEPFSSRSAWCEARCSLTAKRLEEVSTDHRLVLISHFPLREDLIRIRIPRFRIWCGTRRTEDWHTRFNVAVVVTGHLHVRATDLRDGVRFEEVSLGYPRQWDQSRSITDYLRQILPQPETVRPGFLR
jgi:3',5'-cyclic AMP phosphodiesterase CpdA